MSGLERRAWMREWIRSTAGGWRRRHAGLAQVLQLEQKARGSRNRTIIPDCSGSSDLDMAS